MDIRRPKVVAIHQPNFFPWLGYFHKILKSDVFILMDNVQYQKKSTGIVSNRVRILINSQPQWVTMPIVRNYKGTRLYTEMKINNETPWRENISKTIEWHYKKAPFFKEVYPFLLQLIGKKTESLVEYNISAIKSLMRLLGLDISKIIQGSQLDASGESTELLISMVKAVDGNAYLAGGGAHKYQEDHLFKQAEIEVIYQNFKHPEYRQFNTDVFVPGLSIIDVLMNCGTDGTLDLLKNHP